MPPFRATFPTAPAPADGTTEPADPPSASADASVADADANCGAGHVPLHVVAAPPAQQAPGELVVESYVPPDPGPYPQDQPRRNAVRFTPVQVGAAPGSHSASSRPRRKAHGSPTPWMNFSAPDVALFERVTVSLPRCLLTITSILLLQVEAIAAGVQPGLTMVVGPPGTGKTDTAVQIMTVLYHNCPGQRTLLITHSNQVGPGKSGKTGTPG